MDRRKRTILAGIWLAVAGVIALSVEPAVPSTVSDVLRLLVIVMALGLAGLYAFDPKGILSRVHLEGEQ